MTNDDDKPSPGLEADNQTRERPPPAQPASEQRLEQLKTALQRIRNGDMPSETELEKSPLLNHWAIGVDGPLPVLIGIVSNHPLLDDGWITTSPLLYISDDRRWARTVSRFYRLAAPLIDSDASLSC